MSKVTLAARGVVAAMGVVALVSSATAQEVVNVAPCCTGNVATAGTYSGLVRLTLSGSFVNTGVMGNDSFHGVNHTDHSTNGRDPDGFRVVRASADTATCWPGGVSESVGRLLVSSYPPYNPAHEYDVVIDLGPTADRLIFGMADGGCGDNAGGVTVTILPADTDGDGLNDALDNCPAVPNPDQADVDSDGLGNACDACPHDAANDADADGVCGDVDNCPAVSNADQANADSDTLGDACDVDDDGDAVEDATEPPFCLRSQVGQAVTSQGCTVTQVCPCDAPLGRSGWNKASEYRRCVKELSTELLREGRITSVQRKAMLQSARGTSCGL